MIKRIAQMLIVIAALELAYIGALRVFAEPPPPAPAVSPSATILFGGDMMFDRSIRTTIDAKGGDYIFSCLDSLLRSADLVVANLEGPITANPSVSQFSEPGDGNNYTFTFPPSTAQLLYEHNIRMVNLGNNHIMNFRLDGLRATKKYLNQMGVDYFGDPDLPDPERVVRRTIGGIPFAFINWSDWTSDNTDLTAQQVYAEKQAGRVVVVYTHWGEEYKPATDYQKRLGRSFIDAGADIVVGSHPHVVQEHELYTSKFDANAKPTHIYYSLGNMIFDQYWEEAVTRGLLLEVQFDIFGVTALKEIPIVLQRDRRTCIAA